MGQDKEDAMQTTSRFLAFVALGGALALAACGGSPDLSPVAATATGSGDNAVLTSSGNGPGGQPSPAPGTGTCTNDCDGTSQGPGPGAGNGNGPGPSDGFCGNACTGPVGPDPEGLGEILALALQEEYKAQYLYASVLEDFPGAMPFAAIVESEMRHVEALQMLFTRRQMTPPQSIWKTTSFEPPFASIPEACAAGVGAEREDADFYTPYLQHTDLPQDVRNVFTNLQAASLENHLPAFQRCQ
jgi:rubrerythrin